MCATTYNKDMQITREKTTLKERPGYSAKSMISFVILFYKVPSSF
jgi:hypothetical protein